MSRNIAFIHHIPKTSHVRELFVRGALLLIRLCP
jgi:hypothetical protein